jgi:hypothetical protein
MPLFDDEIERLSARIVPLDRFVRLVSSELGQPIFFSENDERGFRYTQPDYRHFCLLRSCRMVSALNASIALVKSGFTQEIGVLLRSILEYNSQVEYVLLHRDGTGAPVGKVAAFLKNFFEDNRRTGPVKKTLKLIQKEVHDAVGRNLDEAGFNDTNDRSSSEMMSNVYRIFSSYVHGRYPESMNLFGGRPGHFHLNGMRGTPKDGENIEMVDTLITTVSNSLVQIVQSLNLFDRVLRDDVLAHWYRGAIESGH